MKAVAALAMFALFAMGEAAWGQASTQPVGVVANIKVLSDKVPDVSSPEAWKKSFIKDGMSDKEKALAVFNSEVAFQHADAPPAEYLQHEDAVLDPIKLYNVYGYTLCSVSAANVAALAWYAGLPARNSSINNHVVPEIYYDKAWHMLDADLIEYFPKADGSIASLPEIVDGVSAWEKEHPEFPVGFNDKNARYQWMQKNDWKNKGPEILSRNPFYDSAGWLPDTVFAWGDTMQQFAKITNTYGSVASMGYRVNLQLREGERLTRNWSNKGMHVNLLGGQGLGAPGCLTGKVGEGEMTYCPKWDDMNPGRVGNGTLEYDVPLASGEFRRGAWTADNLAAKSEDNAGPAVHVKDADKPGILDIRMPSSYVYLSGKADVSAVLGEGGQIKVLLSDNNGLDWKDVATVDKAGKQALDLTPLVGRRYVYILRFVMKGKGTGLDAMKITHDIQHSQRPLPTLHQGENTITFGAGPQEGTITVEGNTSLEDAAKVKQLTYLDFHPVLDGFDGKSIPKSEGKGSITYTVKTPGDMTRIRVSNHQYTQGAKCFFTTQVSFDDGKTWKTIDTPADIMHDGKNIFSRYFTCGDVPKGTRAAQVRFVAEGNSTTAIRQMRIDADYAMPNAGFRPVKVTYVWEEGGIEKKDVHTAAKADETYKIKCESKPVMKSIILELDK